MNTGYMLSGTSPYGIGNGGGGSDAYGLGALPPTKFGIDEGTLSIGGPTLPLMAAAGLALVGGGKFGMWGAVVGGIAGYFVAKFAVLGVTRQQGVVDAVANL